jgi:hypothetical protein
MKSPTKKHWQMDLSILADHFKHQCSSMTTTVDAMTNTIHCLPHQTLFVFDTHVVRSLGERTSFVVFCFLSFAYISMLVMSCQVKKERKLTHTDLIHSFSTLNRLAMNSFDRQS